MIKQFKDDYRWLSNFWMFEKPMPYQGLFFRSVEHFFVAMKSKDFNIRKQVTCIQKPSKAKKFGQTLDIREDWDDIKDSVMLYGLRYKFSKLNPKLRKKLLETGTQEIVEGNWHHDKYWGVDLRTDIGENKLGQLIMKVRDEIKGDCL